MSDSALADRLRELITDALTEPNAVNIHEKLTAALALIPHHSGTDHEG